MSEPESMIVIELDHKRYSFPASMLSTMDFPEKNEYFETSENGKTYRIKIIELNLITRLCKIEINGQSKTARLLRDIDLRIESMGLNASTSKKQLTVSAPMPGLVTSLKVNEGQHVEKGTPLIILEAMKMENVISAPQDATIKSIKVSIGQAVERGLPLIEFEA